MRQFLINAATSAASSLRWNLGARARLTFGAASKKMLSWALLPLKSKG